MCADAARSQGWWGTGQIVTSLVACPPVSGSCSFTLRSKQLMLETTDCAGQVQAAVSTCECRSRDLLCIPATLPLRHALLPAERALLVLASCQRLGQGHHGGAQTAAPHPSAFPEQRRGFCLPLCRPFSSMTVQPGAGSSGAALAAPGPCHLAVPGGEPETLAGHWLQASPPGLSVVSCPCPHCFLTPPTLSWWEPAACDLWGHGQSVAVKFIYVNYSLR